MLSSCRVTVLIALLSMAFHSTAFADLSPERQVCSGKHCDCLLIDGRAQCELTIHPGEPSFVQLPAAITDWDVDRKGRFKLGVTGDTVAIKALAKVRGDDELALQVQAGPHVYASVTVRIAKPLTVANRLVLVTSESEIKAAMEAAVERREEEIRTFYEQKLADIERARDEQLHAAKLEALRSYLEEPTPELAPVYSTSCRSNQACVDLIKARPIGDDLKIRWRIRNREALPLHIAQIRQSNPTTRARSLDLVVVDTPRRKDNTITTVAPGKTVEGVIEISNVTNEDLRSLALAFVTDTGRQLTATGIDFYPIPEDEMEERRRDKEAKGRLWLFGIGMAGLLWVPNPSDKEDLEAATMIGAGARIEYGFNRNLSVWGEGAGAQSSSASFGDVERHATIGRASVGGLLKIGYETITVLRLGIGLQGMQLTTGGGDSSLELEGIVNFGGGVDRRLGNSVVIGASILVGLSTVGGRPRELEAGIHVAYSWKLGTQTAP